MEILLETLRFNEICSAKQNNNGKWMEAAKLSYRTLTKANQVYPANDFTISIGFGLLNSIQIHTKAAKTESNQMDVGWWMSFIAQVANGTQ